MLERITDPKVPRLPIGHPLVGIDFSASPSFLRLGMNQMDYQESQKFGLISVVSFYVTRKNEPKKIVLQELFAEVTHSTERIAQGLDCALTELEYVMEKDGIQITGLYKYSNCSPADQKNIFFIRNFYPPKLRITGFRSDTSSVLDIITNSISIVREVSSRNSFSRLPLILYTVSI